ncbi:cationic peroxidase 1-like [Macadamia integrifolia]|uniref:cationic peroxidase 1-like n=1 Tax=Macadamia integrifolia TaxID=60698 RepID=UPI001C4FB4DB|nr:cationic peroxidase 1-like [Macadamia integrifolia]
MALRAFSYLHLFTIIVSLSLAKVTYSATLSSTFYDKVCPKALSTIKGVVEDAVNTESRMGASLLRLHFHDCFVNGCDGSVLLDNSTNFDSEKNALPNVNSARGFEVIDKIKSQVDKVCGGSIVSCADILAVVARDSVVALGGPTWDVQLGRRDSTTASRTAANNGIPSPALDLSGLINNFKKQGLDTQDLVALSGAHTIGSAKCGVFKNHVYNETNIDPNFASARKSTCPSSGGDNNRSPLDPTSSKFDTQYFSNLVKRRGLLHSDQALYSGGSGTTDALVKSYYSNTKTFYADFAKSMIKMGNINPLTGKKGQIRVNCRKVN